MAPKLSDTGNFLSSFTDFPVGIGSFKDSCNYWVLVISAYGDHSCNNPFLSISYVARDTASISVIPLNFHLKTDYIII